jgi:hypothetical protein
MAVRTAAWRPSPVPRSAHVRNDGPWSILRGVPTVRMVAEALGVDPSELLADDA